MEAEEEGGGIGLAQRARPRSSSIMGEDAEAMEEWETSSERKKSRYNR